MLITSFLLSQISNSINTKMSIRTLLTLVLVSLTVPMLESRRCRRFERINDNLRELVIGKCEFFQNAINQDVFCEYGFRNCEDIWKELSQAFLHRPLCDVPESRYSGYINLTDHPVPKDKSIFWENVYPFIHRYSYYGNKYYSLSDTLTGYIGNGLDWCSDPRTPSGMAATGSLCPGWLPTPECPNSALHGFWSAASRRFGEKASGHVHIMLNASSVPIFSKNTYLAQNELPYLRTGVVTKVTALLVNESPIPYKSKCGDPSLQVLASQMRQKNFTYDCIENRRDVVDLLCLQNPYLPVCQKPSFPFVPSGVIG